MIDNPEVDIVLKLNAKGEAVQVEDGQGAGAHRTHNSTVQSDLHMDSRRQDLLYEMFVGSAAVYLRRARDAGTARATLNTKEG